MCGAGRDVVLHACSHRVSRSGSPPVASALGAHVDLATDCGDLFELVTGQKGIPLDKSQRLVIGALRQRRLQQKVRATLKITDGDMLANPLTKVVAQQHVFHHFLATGMLEFRDEITYRTSRHVAEFGDHELESLWVAREKVGTTFLCLSSLD